MSELLDWVINEVQNWTFRFEDIILHTLTGGLMAIFVKIKEIIAKIKSMIWD